ncbi:Putative olfactory receptor 2W6 [Lemmus lemmus]
MAYDRYAAVCQPLHYTVIMHPVLCQKMVLSAWLGGLGSALILCSLTLKLPRCGHREVDNFFCEMPALIKMAFITQAVMKIKAAARWKKVLNTCGSHLTVVTLFYGTLIYMYMKPQNTISHEEGQFFTLFYTIVTPSLNPLIYTLRNKDVKSAVKRILGTDKHSAKM